MQGFSQLLGNYHDAARDNSAGELTARINGYRSRLTAALKSDYPMLARYMGASEFENMARAFIECTPASYFAATCSQLQLSRFLSMRAADSFAVELAMFEGAVADVFSQRSAPHTGRHLLALSFPLLSWLESAEYTLRPARPAEMASYVHVYYDGKTVQCEELPLKEYQALSREHGQSQATQLTSRLQQWLSSLRA